MKSFVLALSIAVCLVAATYAVPVNQETLNTLEDAAASAAVEDTTAHRRVARGFGGFGGGYPGFGGGYGGYPGYGGGYGGYPGYGGGYGGYPGYGGGFGGGFSRASASASAGSFGGGFYG